jgi:hypothetical protein
MPDWRRIGQEPWAKQVIVGLAGRSEQEDARKSIEVLVDESLRVARVPLPFTVSGWYFPAEVDPTWKAAPKIVPAALARLPRPLWISVYDGESIGAAEFADWVASWLPKDVSVLFQDGVGLYIRTPVVARRYAAALAARLGKKRVAMIAEAFREHGGRFRAATAAELRPQLEAYRGRFPIYLFDGPHYVPDRLVNELLAR